MPRDVRVPIVRAAAQIPKMGRRGGDVHAFEVVAVLLQFDAVVHQGDAQVETLEVHVIQAPLFLVGDHHVAVLLHDVRKFMALLERHFLILEESALPQNVLEIFRVLPRAANVDAVHHVLRRFANHHRHDARLGEDEVRLEDAHAQRFRERVRRHEGRRAFEEIRRPEVRPDPHGARVREKPDVIHAEGELRQDPHFVVQVVVPFKGNRGFRLEVQQLAHVQIVAVAQ